MTEPDKKDTQTDDSLGREIASKEKRKLRAQEEKEESIWFGLGMLGLIGWSVAIPMLACVALGVWIDRTYPGRHSWTLMLLFVGVVLGVLNAWYWVTRERKMIDKPEEDDDK